MDLLPVTLPILLAVTTFFFLVFGSSKPWIAWLFLWAAFITYTRIYLGVHYPGDILVGALVGTICGWIGFKVSEWMVAWDKKENSHAEVNYFAFMFPGDDSSHREHSISKSIT